MKSLTGRFLSSILLIGLLLLLAACSKDRTAEQPAPQATAVPSATCAANASWISNPSEPDFSVDPTDICGFYQYAWQSFLFLTSPTQSGALNFETFPSVSEVFGITLSRAALVQDARTKRKRVFLPRFGKPDLAKTIALHKKALATGKPFNEDEQAGSDGVLISQSNQITYYEQLLDPTAAGFITSCTLQVSQCQTQPAAQTLRFPAASIEIKSSWLPMSKSDANVSLFYTIPGFPVMNNQGGTYTPDLMALDGFHLVFATKSHPELIWATFEHVANAPNGPCVAGQSTPPPAPFKTWNFNNPGNTTCQGINNWPSPAPTAPPFPITQAVRVNAYGGGTPANVSTAQSINASVLGLLSQSSVWRNYFLVGGIWTNGTLPASSSNEVASTSLANSTLETFTQTNNCFNCHNTSSSGTPPFSVSHTFFQATNPAACSYTTQLPQKCQITQPAGATR